MRFPYYIGYFDGDGAMQFDAFDAWLGRPADPEESGWALIPDLAALLIWVNQERYPGGDLKTDKNNRISVRGPSFWLAPKMLPDERHVEQQARALTRFDPVRSSS